MEEEKAEVTALVPLKREQIEIVYQLHTVDGGWRVYDLGIDGVAGISGDPIAKTFARILAHRYYPTTDLGSAAAQVAGIVNRDLDVACLGTRKGNLELMVMWLMLWMADGRLARVSDGEDIGGERILRWGQDACIPLVAAGRTVVPAFVRRFCEVPSRSLASA